MADSLTDAEVKRLASALRARARKIRKGIAPRDAGSEPGTGLVN